MKSVKNNQLRKHGATVIKWLGTAVLVMATPAFASMTMDTVYVGDAGNPSASSGYGGVGSDYFIGKYEVTLAQYCGFLNAVAATDTYGLYSAQMATDAHVAGIVRGGLSGSYSYSVVGSGNRPVTYVSWFDAARFVNWWQNGQPTGLQAAGTTETGAYTLNGALAGIVTRNLDWTFGLPSESEWYKAAYYQPAASGGDGDGYWLYATAGNAIPNSRNGSSTDANSANFYRNVSPVDGVNDGFAVSGSTSLSSGQNYLTDIGAFNLADSYYGTFDQGGNVSEWNDGVSGTSRVSRGGNWGSTYGDLSASSRAPLAPTTENGNVGFRIVMAPEPSAGGLLVLGFAVLAYWRNRTR